MARRKVKILRITGWILSGVVAVILLATIVFYIRRDHIMERVVSYLNEQQPGEVKMEQIYLIPFINFPDVTLHLQEVSFYENELISDTAQGPILSLNEVSVTLDLIQLIRGGIMVSEARLEDGFVHMIIYPDTVSNLEHALGFRFDTPTEKDADREGPALNIDLDKIELVNVRARMDNQVSEDHVELALNQVESSFSYLTGQIQASLEVDIYMNTVKFQTFNTRIDKLFRLKGSLILDPVAHLLRIEPSSLNVSGLEFETWGRVDLLSTPRIDLAFSASNEGLELLNFLFMGILDLDEIEQIGGGSINLNGTVQGHMGMGELPVIRMNGDAQDLGFRIKTLDRDVSDISFNMFATNGRKSDLSEGMLELQEFSAHFPEGNIYANILAANIKSPQVKVSVDCALDLDGLEEMLENDKLRDLTGSVTIRGQVSGNVNRESGTFLDEDGSLRAHLDDVSFVIHHDSIIRDSLKHISGELLLHDSIVESRDLVMDYNGNGINLGFSIENMLLYLLGYEKDISSQLSIASERLDPLTLFRDTAISNQIGGEVRNFYLSAGAVIEKGDLDNYLKHDSVPDLNFTLDTFGITLPMLEKISNVSASVSIGRDTIALNQFEASIGESTLDISGALSNYAAFSRPDSGGLVALDFNISSDLLRARDLLSYNKEFLLPEDYSQEHLKDFRISGNLEAPVAGLVYDSISMDFGLDITDLGWSFRYYPSEFKNFLIQIYRMGDHLIIENVQGSIGENNMALSASLENFADSLVENMYGNIEMYSDLLDFNQLLNYQQPEEGTEPEQADSTALKEAPKLNEMDFPNIDFTVDIGELHYGEHTIYGMNGKLRSSKNKILYLEQFETSPEGRGTLELNGQLNLANPDQYVLSAEMNLKGIDIGDLNLELESGDTTYVLKDNFRGIVDARGLAEIFINPDLKVDMPASVAQFIVTVNDGALINFTPLQAAGKFLDNKDLNNVRFATVRNSFTLIDSKIVIPLMNVESTVGQLLIEGEQGLDGAYLYLVRVPPRLARQAARSAMSERSKDDGEDQVSEMKRGDFLGITLWSNGTESDFKLGDRRNKYKE